MTKTRKGQPRKRGETKDVANVPDEVQPKKEKPPPLEFAVPEGGFNVTMPDGYDFNVHRMLKKKDFQEEGLYYRFRAVGCERQAAFFTQRATEFMDQAVAADRFGSGKDRKQVKRLQKMQAKADTLRNELADKGIDVDAALAEGE